MDAFLRNSAIAGVVIYKVSNSTGTTLVPSVSTTDEPISNRRKDNFFRNPCNTQFLHCCLIKKLSWSQDAIQSWCNVVKKHRKYDDLRDFYF